MKFANRAFYYGLLGGFLVLISCLFPGHTAEITYSTPGSASYTVPPGVYSLQITVNGGAGKDGTTGGNEETGQNVSGYLAVTPGQVLTLNIGGSGEASTVQLAGKTLIVADSSNPSHNSLTANRSASGRTSYVAPSITGRTLMARSVIAGDSGSITIRGMMGISGQVQLDNIGAGTKGTRINGATVRLYNSNGDYQNVTTTGWDGNYSFANLTAGTYYVSVVAPVNETGAVPEQTYASVGSGNTSSPGGTIDGYGPICVGPSPDYVQQDSTSPSQWRAQSTSGPCFGGRQGAVADSNSNILTSNEHVTRVTLGTSLWVTDVNFAFSYNVVTNVNDAGQGSLRQFMLNANSLPSVNSMRFVPTVAKNFTNANSKSWWQITPKSGLPILTDTNTTINGTAYDNIVGTPAFDMIEIGTGGRVGADWGPVTLNRVFSPLLAINLQLPSSALTIAPGADYTIISNMGVYTTISGSGAGIVGQNTVSGAEVTQNVIGFYPDGTAPPYSLNSYGIIFYSNSQGSFTIHNNLVGYTNNAGISTRGSTHTSPSNFIVTNNEVQLGGSGTNSNGISIENSSYVVVSGNLVNSPYNLSLEMIANGGNNMVTQNTLLNSQNKGGTLGAIRLTGGSNNTISNNKITGTTLGPAISNLNTGTGNTISRNQYGNNAGNAIDNTINTNTPDGVTIGTGCTVNSNQLGRPIINTASLSGSSLKLTGSMCATGAYTIEVYKVAADTGDTGTDGYAAGEGIFFLGNKLNLSGGEFNVELTTTRLTSTDMVAVTAIRTTTGGIGSVGDTSEFSANASFNTISGMVFEDVAGNQGSQVGRAGVTVCGFLDDGDGLPNNNDRLQQCTTTASDGSYSLRSDLSGTYWVVVRATTVTPSQGGIGVAEQVYGPAGGQCINSSYLPVTLSAAGACYGGKTATGADGFNGTAATLASAEHLAKVVYGSSNVTGQNFGFSFNVVTNVNDSGQGSLRQFMLNANSITGANVMSFVPAQNTNAGSGSAAWWNINISSGSLPILTDSATTLDGRAYSNADGATQISPNSGNFIASTIVGYGNYQTSIAPIAKPQLSINAPTTGSYTQVIGTTAANTTIQYMSIMGGYNTHVWAGAGSTGFTLQHNALGVSPNDSNNLLGVFSSTNGAVKVGDLASNTMTSGLSGTIYHNYIYGSSGAINLYGVSANQYSINANYVKGTSAYYGFWDGIDVIASSNITVTGNYLNAVYGIPINLTQSNGVIVTGNTSTGSNYSTADIILLSSAKNNTITGNDVSLNNRGILVTIQSQSNSNLISQNRLANSTTNAAVAVSGNSNGNLITQNVYGNNSGNAIDLNNDRVTLNATACLNKAGVSTGNSGLARPVLTSANLINSTTLEVAGTICGTGSFTIEVYQAMGAGFAVGIVNNDMGSDNHLAGEGIVYLGNLTANDGTFSGTLPISGLSVGNSISATAIRTSTEGIGVVGDTSEFSANILISNPNFGSAPDSYKTLKVSGGAEHYIKSGLSLGKIVPASTDGSPVTAPAAAAGDGISVLPLPMLTLNTTSYSVLVNATNTTGVPATLVGWIDYNGNGVFDTTEGVSITVPTGTNNGSFTLTWPNVQALTPQLGVTYARFRLSTDTTLTTSTPGGVMRDGEVEDYGGTGVLEIMGRTINGTVFNDRNRNGSLDSGESGSGQALYIKLAVQSSDAKCMGPALKVIAADMVTGTYSLIGVAPGNYCVIVDNNNTLSDITPTLPSSWMFTGGGNGIVLASLTKLTDINNVNIGINNATLASGLVFYDIGSNTAYDGTQDSGEKGVGGVTVTISGNTGSATVTTNADGTFNTTVPASVSDGNGNVTFTLNALNKAVSVSKGVTGLTDSTAVTQYGMITVTASSLVGGGLVRFGLAPVTTLQPNGLQSGSPGSRVYFSHIFTADSAGTLVLDFSDQQASPPNSNWRSTLLTDPNCSGMPGSGSTVIHGPITIESGKTKLCLFNQVEIPLAIGVGSQWIETLQAQFIYGSTVAGSNHSVTDTTTVGSDGKLQLVKTVDKSSVRPGESEVLTYTIQYSNQDIGTMNPVVIDANIPAYTTYIPGSAKCLPPIPSEVNCIVDTSQLPALKWMLDGDLKPAESGAVTYQVTVN